MNQNLRLGTLATALLLVAAALYIGPRPARAICPCNTANTYVTDCWGRGADCNQAISDLSSACMTLAVNACWNMGYDGACQVSVTQNSPAYCWYNTDTGGWQVSGRATFHCKTCVDIDPRDPKVP